MFELRATGKIRRDQNSHQYLLSKFSAHLCGTRKHSLKYEEKTSVVRY